jgi:hypothetical protein
MGVFYRLESRSLSTGMAQRTIKNFQFMKQAHERGQDVHIVTQVVNSVLSLLIFPIQKEDAFCELFSHVPLSNPPDFRTVRTALPDFPSLPSLRVRQFKNCKNVRRFLKRIRNAVSHRRIDFSSESHDLDKVMIRLSDVATAKDPSIEWDISISAQDLLSLCRYIADEIIRRVL